MKTATQAMIRFGYAVAEILQRRLVTGYPSPQIVQWKESDLTKAFTRRLRLVGVSGVSLHSFVCGVSAAPISGTDKIAAARQIRNIFACITKL